MASGPMQEAFFMLVIKLFSHWWGILWTAAFDLQCFILSNRAYSDTERVHKAIIEQHFDCDLWIEFIKCIISVVVQTLH